MADNRLCRLVFMEYVSGYRISASLTRFGGLYVAIDHNGDTFWEGDNILEAREYLETARKEKVL